MVRRALSNAVRCESFLDGRMTAQGSSLKTQIDPDACLLADAWIEGEIMYIEYSDLPFKAGSENVMLFQPQSTVKEGALFRITEDSMKKAFEDSMSLTGLVHVGSLVCNSHNDEHGGPYYLGPRCGGSIKLKSARSIKLLRLHGARNEMALVCSNPKCGMGIISNECPTEGSLANLLLHLMLKQMIPRLPILNYVDCGLKDESHYHDRHTDWKDIKALGLISLALEVLWGVAPLSCTYPQQIPERYALGFMLTPGMRTMDGCGGYGEWLKFLVAKKFEILKGQYRAMASMLLGPKLRQAA